MRNKKLEKLIKEEYFSRFGKKDFVPGKTLIPASGKDFDWREMVKMTEAVLEGWWTEGHFADEFEKKFAQFVGVKYCVTATSGSSANLLAIAALTSYHLGGRRLKPGDEVITLAAGFPTTVNPLILYQLVPVFVDIDLETLNVNVNQLKKAISKKTKAIFLPHHLGNPFNIKEVKRLCDKHNLWLVEDCCDALGSKYRGRYVGSFGDLATFSFYAGHHITMGEGGAIVSNDAGLASIIRSIRDWGREYWFKTGQDLRKDKGLGSIKKGKLPDNYDHKFIFSEIGYNLKITDIQAALGLAQLEKTNKFFNIRKKNFNYLSKRLKKFNAFFFFQKKEKFSEPSWFGFLLTLKPGCPFSREELLVYLNEHGIATRMFLGGNLIKQPYFQNYRIKFRAAGSLTNTDYVLRNSFWIGLFQAIDQKRRAYVADSIEAFFKREILSVK